jgi:DNA-binding LacI/PurR family transcriptional regulator
MVMIGTMNELRQARRRPPRKAPASRSGSDAPRAGVACTATRNLLLDRVDVGDAARRARRLTIGEPLHAPRPGRADTIGIFSARDSMPTPGPGRPGLTMEIAAGAARRALSKGISVVLVAPQDSSGTPVRRPPVDGAIVIEPLENDAEVALLQSRGVTVVSIGRQLGHGAVPFVDLQPYQSASAVIAHLHDRSHGKLGLLVGAQPRFGYRQTELAYYDFMRARGEEPIVRRVDESSGSEGAYDATRRLLSEHPQLDGLYVPVDAFAIGARRAAADLGIDIPGDLKLATGHDGCLARECDPPLTALDLHPDELAALAIDLLLEQMSSANARSCVSGPKATLVPRESSCGV